MSEVQKPPVVALADPRNHPCSVVPEKLTIGPMAYLKLLFMLRKGGTEVGGFGVMYEPAKLYIDEFVMPKQYASSGFVRFDDDDMINLTAALHERGINPIHWAPVWFHTHPPGMGPTPSGHDENTFKEAFKDYDWAIMAIMANDRTVSARLRCKALGPGGFTWISKELTVEADLGNIHQIKRTLDLPAWHEEYDTKVRPYHEDPTHRKTHTYHASGGTSYKGGYSDGRSGAGVRDPHWVKDKFDKAGWDGRGEPPAGMAKKKSNGSGNSGALPTGKRSSDSLPSGSDGTVSTTPTVGCTANQGAFEKVVELTNGPCPAQLCRRRQDGTFFVMWWPQGTDGPLYTGSQANWHNWRLSQDPQTCKLVLPGVTSTSSFQDDWEKAVAEAEAELAAKVEQCVGCGKDATKAVGENPVCEDCFAQFSEFDPPGTNATKFWNCEDCGEEGEVLGDDNKLRCNWCDMRHKYDSEDDTKVEIIESDDSHLTNLTPTPSNPQPTQEKVNGLKRGNVRIGGSIPRFAVRTETPDDPQTV